MPAEEKHIPDRGNQVPSTAITPYDPQRLKHGGVGGKAIAPSRRGRKTPKRSRWSKL